MPSPRALPAGTDLKFDCEPDGLPPEFRGCFVRLGLGEEGRAFLDRALATRPGTVRTALQRALRAVMSDFDANGLLGMYPMHLLGTEEWRMLLGERPEARHLDVGAGSGDVTCKIAPLVRETVTTETSRVMASKLRRRGFRCVVTDVAESEVPDPHYDLVTCLNVLDRCARPLSLLDRLASALGPGGTLVVATPLPFDPFVYDGPRSLDPLEKLDLPRDGWERGAAALARHARQRLGLEVEAITRVPYLCQGDAEQPLYVLDDALLVCRKPLR